MFLQKEEMMFNNFLKNRKKKLEEEIKSIEFSIQDKTNYLNEINEQIKKSNNEVINLSSEISKVKSELNHYLSELGTAEGIITMQDLGLEYTPSLNDLNEISKRKEDIQKKIGNLIGCDKAIITTRIYRIDGSEAKGRQFQKTFCENLMTSFNLYFEKKKKAITSNNYEKTEELIEKKFQTINNKAALMGVSINKEYLELCLEYLSLELDDKIAKAEEKEKLKEEHRRLKEQEKLLAEAEKERKRLEDERKNLQKLFAKAVSEQEQEDIKNKLAEVDKRTEEIDWRISHQSAGWLYIATTPCLEGMYKAGCTKQLNPLNRLAQLSSASVPYPFECHGLVFSEDVFDLEAKLHKRLDSVRVNKMNRGKEFFYGSPEEVIKILKEEFKVDVHFVDENWVEEE